MLWSPLGLYKTNADLRTFSQRKGTSVGELRKAIPIAVIDDEPFAAEVNLRSHGYSITQIGDVKRIDEVAKYRIVLCDLMGVGRHFDPSKQGASLIHEIRLAYPGTIVVAYSGSSLNSPQARSAKENADLTLKKDEDISEWRRVLDDLIRKAADPYFLWQRTRLQLTTMEIDTRTILLLEDAYVRSVLAGDSEGKTFGVGIQKANLSNDARSIVQSLVASAIFKIFVG
ncbi:response regulator [Rhizobium leguminosarum]|uniref:Response regulatory domain-containing protein n=1 Tax=Rhizobium leguminosarum TaxID=384 RepID=A0A7W9ZSC0_RHILE|nr:response regulator [Rhizobium leguminosarum]MBB6221927.1 hypothetical protein [Rhizobium leguminosarum]